ncbi:MAG: hypothetical protein QOG62_900 [Thermoleophilaceae bacterium]|nr:hypothetical protein [Thermoleophilaceae bacterium]
MVALDPPRNGGVSRIGREVCRLLAGRQADGFAAVFLVNRDFAATFGEWIGHDDAVVIPWLPGGESFAGELSPDVIVSPLFGGEPLSSVAALAGTPHIVGMPDALSLDHPELFSAGEERDRRATYEALRTASRVVTLSQDAKRRLIDHLALDPDRVTVVPAAGGDQSGAITPPGVEGPYVVYGANDWPHKRHELLLQAMRQVWPVRPELKLVLTGFHRSGFLKQIGAEVEASEGRVVDLGYVAEDQIWGLYRDAEALVFPSSYEGFGMPVIEAMSVGCPVVCSDAGSLPEVVGDAAVTVSSDDPAAWAGAILKELPDRREALIARGFSQAERFTWDRVRAEWGKVLDDVTGDLLPGPRQGLSVTAVARELARWAAESERNAATASARLEALQAQDRAIMRARADIPLSVAFGDYTVVEGLEEVEGPYPQWHLPHIRWGGGSATVLRVGSEGRGKRKLRLQMSTPLEGQVVRILWDSAQIWEQAFGPADGLITAEIKLPRSAAPDNELRLDYSVHGPQAELERAVLYRELRIL